MNQYAEIKLQDLFTKWTQFTTKRSSGQGFSDSTTLPGAKMNRRSARILRTQPSDELNSNFESLQRNWRVAEVGQSEIYSIYILSRPRVKGDNFP